MLKRNASAITSMFDVKNNKLICKETTIIEFPKYYEDKGLLTFDKNITLYGIFATIVGNNYAVSQIPTTLNTTPLLVKEVEKKGMDYYQFHYGKNMPIIESMTVIRNKLLSYNIFESFLMLNKIPWFIEYEDILRILDNFPRYGESNIGENFISNEVITSFIARVQKNPLMFYRQNLAEPYMYVDLNDVFYSTKSTLNRIGGNYFMDSLTSAIVQKETESTKLETLARR